MNTNVSQGTKTYSILLSAYACEPGIGSEPAVGWEWATRLAQSGNSVHVLTRAKNKQSIESVLTNAPIANLTFSYFDVPRWLSFWKRGNRGVHLYYFLWQIGIFFVARRLVRQKQFDLIHHVTYVTARFPSFMGLLGLPFVFGPLAGGEYAPRRLWSSMDKGAVVRESLRALSMMWWRFSPLLNLSFGSAQKIFVTSAQTLSRLPRHAQRKAEVMLGIGGNEIENSSRTLRREPNATFSILFVGRFLYWKGMKYGLDAVARLLEDSADWRLTMIGDGPCLKQWQDQAKTLGIADKVQWLSSMPRAVFLETLPQYDVLLFPSLHDSGAMVVMEAMTAGLPVVCLDYGGPAVLVDETCGFKVGAKTPSMATHGLYAALHKLISDRDLGPTLGQAGHRRAVTLFSWPGRVKHMLQKYGEVVNR